MSRSEQLRSITDVTIRELRDIMNVTPRQAAKDVIKKAMGRSVRSNDPLFWPAGLMTLGLVEMLELIGTTDESGDKSGFGDCSQLEQDIKKAIDAHISLWKDKDGRIRHVDDALFGYALMRLSKLYNDEHYKLIADKIGDFLKDAPKDIAGSIIYNSGKSGNIFADGIGQVTLFLASHVYEKMKADETSYTGGFETDVHYYNENNYLSEMGMLYLYLMNYYLYGRDERSELIYHGYSLKDEPAKEAAAGGAVSEGEGHEVYKLPHKLNKSEKKGILGWGRAEGWLLMGLSEAALLEKELKKKDKSGGKWASYSVIPWYMDKVKALLEYQRPDGGWSWQIQAVEGHIDMSATGMIAYSIAKGYKEGLLTDPQVAEALKKSRDCMLEYSVGGKVTDALSSCDDFAVHYQTYGHYPWGQGSVLAALALIQQIL